MFLQKCVGTRGRVGQGGDLVLVLSANYFGLLGNRNGTGPLIGRERDGIEGCGIEAVCASCTTVYSS